MGALPVLYPILRELDVRDTTNALVPSEADIDLGRIVLLLALNRLLAPQPLYHVQDWLSGHVLEQVLGVPVAKAYDNRLGRALDRLHPHLAELWARLITRAIAVYELDLSVLHWDITSIYFEGAYTDSHLATYGCSRDHRPDTKQVNLEVDVTHDGYTPVRYEVLAGNTADITRPVPHLEALLRLFSRPELAERKLRPLLVSDSKMVTAEGVAACHDQHLMYLGPLPNGKATDRVVASVDTEELAACPLDYRPKRVRPDDERFVPYRGVWRPFVFVCDEQHFTDRALVVWSAGKQRLDEQKRRTLLKRLLNALEGIQRKLNTRRFKRRSYVEARLATVRQANAAVKQMVEVDLSGTDGQMTLRFRIDRERLAAAQRVDGRYALVTNGGHLTASEALTLYKGQDGIEKRFRTAKGPLLVQPLFVRSDERIEGLVFITLLALLVRAILERACRQRGQHLTADRLLKGFASLQAVDLRWADGSQQRRAAPLTDFQADVLATLEWPGADAYAQMEPLVR